MISSITDILFKRIVNIDKFLNLNKVLRTMLDKTISVAEVIAHPLIEKESRKLKNKYMKIGKNDPEIAINKGNNLCLKFDKKPYNNSYLIDMPISIKNNDINSSLTKVNNVNVKWVFSIKNWIFDSIKKQYKKTKSVLENNIDRIRQRKISIFFKNNILNIGLY